MSTVFLIILLIPVALILWYIAMVGTIKVEFNIGYALLGGAIYMLGYLFFARSILGIIIMGIGGLIVLCSIFKDYVKIG